MNIQELGTIAQYKLNLKVIELTDSEVKEHEEYLLRMKEETGTDPIGLNKNV